MAGSETNGAPLEPCPPDESAVPDELVPGAATLVPEAPPDEWCDPPPPPRANAAVPERLTQRMTQRTKSFVMPRLPEHAIKATVGRR